MDTAWFTGSVTERVMRQASTEATTTASAARLASHATLRRTVAADSVIAACTRLRWCASISPCAPL